MNILKVQNLCKKIGKKEILKDVSFEINSGDILAFIGPNGAGKTTTIKCILGLQKLNSGSVIINGYNIKNDFVKAINNVGCIVESPDVYMYLTGMQNLELQASLYHDIEEDDIAKVVALVGLEKRIYDKVSKYSLGMRQRLGIALALIHNPNLLILDEPTNGLDPEGIKELRELLKSLAKKGMGILISSHNLSELESFCNRVVILSKGEIIESSSITDIKKLDENKYILKVDDTNKVKDIIKKTDTIKDKNYIEVIREEKDIPTLINNFIKKDVLLYEIKREDISLEEAFIKKAGGKKID
mgnify:FL=1